MEGLAYVEGDVVPLADAAVPLLDRGLLMGDGVFETLRTVGGKVWQEPRHRARMEAGAAWLGLEPEAIAWQDALDALVAAGTEAFGDELYLRLNLTPGAMEDVAGGDGAALTGICRPFRPYPLRHASRGIRVIITDVPLVRTPWSGCKTLSMMAHVVARRNALAVAAHDGLLTDGGGQLVEASTSNLFAFVDGTVHAPGPEQGAVDGVTRQVILELIDDTGLPVAPTLSEDQLAVADEVWLTNTIGGVTPVTQVDDRQLGEVKGDLTGRLMHAYEDMLRGRT